MAGPCSQAPFFAGVLKEALLGLGASPTRDELYKALGLVSTPAPDDVLTVTRTWQTHITRFADANKVMAPKATHAASSRTTPAAAGRGAGGAGRTSSTATATATASPPKRDLKANYAALTQRQAATVLDAIQVPCVLARRLPTGPSTSRAG